MNAFFADLGARLARGATARGAPIGTPELDPKMAHEILELARVVAHGHERRFAPLASFLAGMAAGRLATKHDLSPAELVAYVRELREALERGPRVGSADREIPLPLP